MTINELVNRCYENAKECGWTEREVEVPEQVALIHSEISEALEAYRNHESPYTIGENGKPEGIAVEYADAVIRICHYITLLDHQFGRSIDFEEIIDKKLTYNLTRGHRHGGKAI